MRHSTNPWLVLVLVCLAQFMVVLDATIVNVALPTIQADLDMTDTGPAVDRQRLHPDVRRLPPARRPRRRPHRPAQRLFVAGVVIFTAPPSCAGSAAHGVAHRGPCPSGPRRRARLPGRALDRDLDLREGAERTKALASGRRSRSAAAAVGLLLGGILTETLSWPWIFFVNVPVGIATFLLSLRFVPESKDDHAHRASTSPARSASRAA